MYGFKGTNVKDWMEANENMSYKKDLFMNLDTLQFQVNIISFDSLIGL